MHVAAGEKLAVEQLEQLISAAGGTVGTLRRAKYLLGTAAVADAEVQRVKSEMWILDLVMAGQEAQPSQGPPCAGAEAAVPCSGAGSAESPDGDSESEEF